uniref:RAB3GAP2_N domain-containing protein n=1 Tax=Macrostomum lignano TaxID=282301 RepID=A0A1I8FC36_9PLAT
FKVTWFCLAPERTRNSHCSDSPAGCSLLLPQSLLGSMNSCCMLVCAHLPVSVLILHASESGKTYRVCLLQNRPSAFASSAFSVPASLCLPLHQLTGEFKIITGYKMTHYGGPAVAAIEEHRWLP